MRTTLVAALAACAESKVRARARRFLSGLSADELQFIAGYLGDRILRSAVPQDCGCELLGWEDSSYPSDRDHKMILLMEYLRQTEAQGRFLPT